MNAVLTELKLIYLTLKIMKHTDFTNLLNSIRRHEIRELKKAVGAYGGKYEWFDEDGCELSGDGDYPIIPAYSNNDNGISDYFITRVEIIDDWLFIYGRNVDCDMDEDELEVEYIPVGKIQNITECVPPTEKVSDAVLNYPMPAYLQIN